MIGIAPARFAALHAFQQESVVAAFAQFQKRRNRRFQIGDQPCVDRLRAARIIGAREGGEFGLDRHRSLTILRR